MRIARGRGGPFLHITARNNGSHSQSVELRLAIDTIPHTIPIYGLADVSVYSGCGNSL